MEQPEFRAPFLRNVSNIRRIAFDIGQSFVKLAYSTNVLRKKTTHEYDLVDDSKCAHRLHCLQVRVSDFSAVLDFIKQCGKIEEKTAAVASTYHTREIENVIVEKLGLKLFHVNQMDCLVKGTNFLIKNIESESFTYDHKNDACPYNFRTFRPNDIFPFLLVNVGTGISVFKINNYEDYERVGGSSLGGGAVYGLANLLTKNNDADLDAFLKMAEDGDHRQIDLLVSDIYGGKYDKLGLTGDLIAGSFGKCCTRDEANKILKTKNYNKDVVRSLILMISNCVGQIAYLYAEKEGTRRIYFNGYLIRNHAMLMRTISYAIHFWSQGEQEAHFLRHEGYTSVIGAFLQMSSKGHTVDLAERHSWHEYYSEASDLGRFVPKAPLSAGFDTGILELECANMVLRPFPLLAEDICEYIPDVVDLTSDPKAREFWLSIMEDSVDKVMIKAIESQAKAPTAAERASVFREKYVQQLHVIREKAFAYGSCTVRNLLDLREQILKEQQFDDCFLAQKTLENNVAMKELGEYLQTVDQIEDDDIRLFHVCRGLLAGNVFDWGAKKVIELMESSNGLTFSNAVDTIPISERPWLVDTYSEFVSSINEKPYKCATVFVDNSGYDFVLGVIPFVRELLRRGTKVIIVTNQTPALNDLTYSEVLTLLPRFFALDEALAVAFESERLIIHHNGQGSPCLDFRKLSSELNEAVLCENVDLVVIEGMGRALHTNLHARFTCDSLKAAVIKTQWLAEYMGGELFSVVFKFEKGTKQL